MLAAEKAMDVQRFLIGLGSVILIVGIMWPILSRMGLGRLPGDIVFQRDGATFYFPIVTCVVISIVGRVLVAQSMMSVPCLGTATRETGDPHGGP